MAYFKTLLISYEVSVIFRLFFAVMCGGYIGAERIRKKRPAGLKTHAIVAMGAALVVLTTEYLMINTNPDMDVSRSASAVISGIGFLGAGTIMVNGRNQVTGLTTAAGLWLAACIGIAVGSEFYLGAASAVLLLAFINKVLGKIDRNIQSNSKIMNIMADVLSPETINTMNRTIIEMGCSIITSVSNRQESLTGIEGVVPITISVFMSKTVKHIELLNKLATLEGVIAVEEV